ncbi:MAG: hypothetical protein CMP10_20335 [Zetaproteobacteria bacterium]|nr:hypothetical protein [Pseudobdellovibrionaceae bacterium]
MNKNSLDIIFMGSDVTSDQQAQIRSAIHAVIGEPDVAWDLNNCKLMQECRRKRPDGSWTTLE